MTAPAVAGGEQAPALGGRRRRGVALLAAGAAILGTGTLLLGASMPGARTATVGPNLAIDAEAADNRRPTANNSPSLVRNPVRPANLVVANRIDNPLFSCALHVSSDAGASWAETAIPFPDGEESPPRCFAPDVAFGPDGRLFVAFSTLIGAGNSPHAAWIATSADGGRTLSVPTKVLGPLAFQVRLTADPVRRDRLYLAWLQASGVGTLSFTEEGNPVDVSRSDDGGRTWSPPRSISAAGRRMVVAPSPVLGAGGSLYCAYLDLGDDRLDYEGAHEGRGGEPYNGTWQLVVARSLDGGRTWRDTVVDPALVPTTRFVVYLPELPSLAVDRARRRVYVAYQSARQGDSDVYVWTSTDGGIRFSRGTRVNDTPRHDRTSQYLPQLAVAPDGRLDVVYDDRRGDPADVLDNVSLQSSVDGGRSFGSRIRLSDHAFDSRIGFGSETGLADLGSRLALVSTDGAALAVWPDTRAGGVTTPASGGFEKQDLARAVVAFRRPSPLRTPLRAAGAALLGLVGLLLVAGSRGWRSTGGRGRRQR
ncbi:MAG TPA: sialidase family protein [Acidimicrobiales bacterium]|nr:sialidase family protein [Acidimicrobiales bacterium]